MPEALQKDHMGCDVPTMTMPMLETSEATFHTHLFNITAQFTDPPRNLPKGHQHEILRDDDGRIIGFGEAEGHSHEVPEHLIEYLAEVKGSKNYSDSNTIQGAEIFKVGKWNGDDYTRKDLDDMVSAFDKVGFQVPIKLGHKEISGAPAYGWVERVRRIGDKLIADFKDLPEKIFDALKGRRFDAVSSEVFWDLERSGKKFRRVLKAVALLGGETPAVSGLAPLRTVINSIPENEFGKVGTYNFKIEEFYSPDQERDGDNDLSGQQHEGEEGEVTMMTVDEMKKKIQELQDQLDEAEENVEEAKANAVDPAKLKTAEEKVKTLQAELKTATDDVKNLAENQGKEIAALKETVKTLTDQLGNISETRRQERIKQKVGEVPIPALRRYMEPLYNLATSTAKTAMFTAKEGEAGKETQIETVLDAMVEHIKANAQKLFMEFSEANNKGREEGSNLDQGEDPSAKADKLARAHMDKSGEKDYAKAVRHVLAADPALKKAYAGFSVAAKH